MNTFQRKTIFAAIFISALFALPVNSFAMHIMEGYLPLKHCIAWGVICIPFIVMGFLSINKILSENPKGAALIAMSAAFVFVISSLKIPTIFGSCSHMTGTGLGAILFGPWIMSVLGIIVLIFQALLLAHGGLTTLGANTFSMAVAGPFVAYIIYKTCIKLNLSKRVSVFFAAFFGDLVTYFITSMQLSLSYSSNDGFINTASKFMAVFMPTQLPLAIIEGILTVVIIIGLENYALPELKNTLFGTTKNSKEA